MDRVSTFTTEKSIQAMRRAGRAAAATLEMIAPFVQPGMSTLELNNRIHAFITRDLGGKPATLGYRGYPRSCCISINNVVCHGVPSARLKLKNGDIANIDVTVELDGYFGDSSMTFLVGTVASSIRKLVRVTRECLFLGIAAVKPQGRIGDVGAAIAAHAHGHGYSVVMDFCGHGIGTKFHDKPEVMHDAEPNTGAVLVPGMCFTIEPMINAGRPGTKVMRDGWTAVTIDGKASAQWEHTVMVSAEGCEILTLRDGEKYPVINN